MKAVRVAAGGKRKGRKGRRKDRRMEGRMRVPPTNEGHYSEADDCTEGSREAGREGDRMGGRGGVFC